MISTSHFAKLTSNTVLDRIRRPIQRNIAIVSVTVQLLSVLCQVCALLVYDTHISQHMPSLIKPNYSDHVTVLFWRCVILGPFFLQILLLPITVIAIPSVTRRGVKLTLAIMSPILCCWGACCSFLAFCYTVGTFD